MNWDAISAIFEAVGVIAVVISLLYLAFQIRFARLAAADTSRTARAIGVRENVLAMVNNTGLRENWIKSSLSVFRTVCFLGYKWRRSGFRSPFSFRDAII